MTTQETLYGELSREVARVIRNCRAEGTVGLGFESLYCALDFRALRSAPSGTNAAYFLKEELRRVVAQNPSFSRFVLRD